MLKHLLQSTYRLSPVRLQTFNEDIKLSENITKIRAMQSGKQYMLPPEAFGNISSLRNDCKEEIRKILANHHVTTSNQVYAEFGFELMPFSISVKDKKIESGTIELLDGFRRMFFSQEVPNIDVLVKVYDELDARLFMNAMIVFNSWKFKDSKFPTSYIDRGFRLGLFYRYGIDFTKLYSSYDRDMTPWNLLHIYTSDFVYSSLWNNNKLPEDLLLLHEMSNHLPVFKVETKRKMEEFDSSLKSKWGVSYFMEKILKEFIIILGAIRRQEFLLEKKQSCEVERKSFSLQWYQNYLSRPELQHHFIKLSKMTVRGFVDNYINDHLLQDMKDYMSNNYAIQANLGNYERTYHLHFQPMKKTFYIPIDKTITVD